MKVYVVLKTFDFGDGADSFGGINGMLLDPGFPLYVEPFLPPGTLYVFSDGAMVHSLDDELDYIRVCKAPCPKQPQWLFPTVQARPEEPSK